MRGEYNYQDIHLSDVELRTQFIKLFATGNYAQAFAIIDNNPHLESNSFVANILTNEQGSILTRVLRLEKLYFFYIEDNLREKLSIYNSVITDFDNKKIWNSTINYRQGNFVYYNDEIYLCIEANNNVIPTTTKYWAYLGLKGKNGSPSIGTNLRYNWTSSGKYNPKDVVLYNENLYVSKTVNTNKIPSTSPSDWEIFMLIPKAKIVVSKTPPTEPYEGMIWWGILN